MWLGGTSVYPGWLMDINQYILFILERPEDIEAVTARFRRVGFVNMCGYLCGGMNTCRKTAILSQLGTITATELTLKLSRDENNPVRCSGAA